MGRRGSLDREVAIRDGGHELIQTTLSLTDEVPGPGGCLVC